MHDLGLNKDRRGGAGADWTIVDSPGGTSKGKSRQARSGWALQGLIG